MNNTEDKKEYKFKCIPVSQRYYSDESSFGVFSFQTKDDIPHCNDIGILSNNTLYEDFSGVKVSTLAGSMQQLYIGSEYEVVATLEYNSKFKSYQYKPKTIISVEPKTIEQQKRFLNSIITERQANILLEKYPNIVEDIINGKDDVDLSKLKGIAEKTYGKIRESILNNYIISDILILLQPLGVTYNMIKRLLMGEPNPALLKEKLLDNPYLMLKLRGMAFKTVDGLALKLNKDIKVSAKRTYAFIQYYLRQLGNGEGHTWIYVEDLKSAIRDNINECMGVFDDIIKNEQENEMTLHFHNDKLGLLSYYNEEKGIYDILKDINSYDKLEITEDDIKNGIEKAEKEQGFKLTEEQIEVVKNSLNENVTVITGKAGCVDCDTEFFNGREWKKISEFDLENDLVLQYNLDGTANLVKPLRYIKTKCDNLNLIQNKTKSVNQCVCDEHNLVVLTSKNNIYKKPFKDFYKQHNANPLGASDKFITHFKYDGEGLDLTDVQIRIMVACIADGTLTQKRKKNKNKERDYTRIRIRILKQRKINRLRELLKKANIEYKEDTYKDGYANFRFDMPMSLREKKYDSRWYKCSQEQLQIIADELIYWDGSYNSYKNKGRFSISTSVKSDADFIQFVYSSIGKRASINICNRIGRKKELKNNTYTCKSLEYTIVVSKHKNVSIHSRRLSNKIDIKKITPKDGYKYCFTVPSGMLVLRRENTINVTGNCGKSSISRAILNIYNQANYSISCCALSACASQRIEEATNFPSSTIHRLLGVSHSFDKEFEHTHETPLLSDIILVDECSMINCHLFYCLLSAIKEGAKIIMCGDNGQLPPIGYGNVFSDIISKKDKFNINRLTKVLRQAEDSGILTDANKIRQGIMPILQPELKIVSGKLQDMTYVFRETREGLNSIAIKSYMGSVERDGVENTTIICPRRNNCLNSTSEINIKINDLYIKNKSISVAYGNNIYYIGSKVMQIENNYDKDVFNGEIGYVRDICDIETENEDGKVVKKTMTRVEYIMGNKSKDVVYEKSELGQIDFAYALTVHKCVTGDTWIYTSNGLMQLKELDNGADIFESKPIESHIKVLNGKNLESPLNFYNAGIGDCKKITTKQGYSLTATNDHKLDVLCEDGYVYKKYVYEIKEGDYLLVNTNNNIYGSNIKIPEEWYVKKESLNLRTVVYKYPKELTKDFARFLGCMVADGVISKSGIKYGKNHKNVVEDFNNSVYNIFGYKAKEPINKIPNGKQGGMWLTEINSMFIKEFCKKIDGIQPNNKFVPDIILKSPKEFQIEFLKGVFEDGSVCIKNDIFDHIFFTAKEELLTNQVQMMLLNLGIVCTKYFRRNSYTLFIYGVNCDKFIKQIGFISDIKNDKANKYYNIEKHTTNVSIPYVKKIVISVINDYKLKFNIRKDRSTITNYVLDKFIRYCKSNNILDKRLEYLSDICYNVSVQEIKKIKYTTEQTYCIEMPLTHKFVQNGIRGYNCQGMGIKNIISIVDNTHTIMLDSCLLYTALTRAKKKCLLLAEPNAFKKCVDNNKGKVRRTWLKHFNY